MWGAIIGVPLLIGVIVFAALGLGRLDATNGGELLPRPPRGGALATYLADGTPVWAIDHGNGTVSILSAFDTHEPFQIHKLLWWCPSARGLENPQHGSRWDEWGVKIDGPAPRGLGSWEATAAAGSVAIGAALAGPSVETVAAGRPAFERDWCSEPDAPKVFHTFDDWEVWESPAEAVAAAPTDWILVDGTVVNADGGLVLCALSGCDDHAAIVGAEPVPAQVAPFSAPTETRFLVRIADGAIVDLTRIVGSGG